MDQELKQYLDAKFAEAKADLDGRFAQVDGRFAQVDARFAQVDARFAHMEQLIVDVKKSLEREIGLANRRLDGIDNHLDRIDTRQMAIDITLAGISRSIGRDQQLASASAGTQMAQQRAIDDLAARVKRLESTN